MWRGDSGSGQRDSRFSALSSWQLVCSLWPMRLQLSLIHLVAWMCPLLAEDAFTPGGTVAVTTPTAGAEGYDAIVRITDAPWIERELARFSAALGRDPKPLRKALAEALYHTSSLEAVDTSRPAVFVWRKGPAPLQAIIPIKADRRRQFIEEFGVMGSGEPPLVRVGDRDGTVVYSQNFPEGLREYRLLVSDSVAYLARNADECRKLAANPGTLLPVLGGGVAPVSLTCSGEWMQANGLLSWAWSPRLPIQQWMPGSALLDATQNALLGQVASATFEIRDGAGNRARLSARLTARPDSELAAWIASQQNQAIRVQTQVGGASTAIKVAGHISWQDKLEQVGRALVPVLAVVRGAEWTPVLEESWVQALTTAQRSTDMVWLLDVPRVNSQVQTLILEQPRAEEQLQQLEVVASALVGAKSTPGTITGFPATCRSSKATSSRQSLDQVLSATTRHVLLIDAWNLSPADALRWAEETARRLQQVAAPVGETAVVSVWCNLGRLVMLAPGIDTEVTIPEAIIQGTVRTAGVNVLNCEIQVPLAAAAQALSHLPDMHTAIGGGVKKVP